MYTVSMALPKSSLEACPPDIHILMSYYVAIQKAHTVLSLRVP
jgi:hypothetical protein